MASQAKPTEHTEHALRMILRFMQSDMSVVVRLPAEGEVLQVAQDVVESAGGWFHMVEL